MNPDEADCLLLGGGGDVAPCLYGGVGTNARDVDIERDVNELYLIRKFLKTDRYVFGICRGEQIINVYFGGTLYNTLSSRHAYRGRDRLHAATFKGLLKKTYGEAGIVNSAHRQAVQRLGSSLKATAIADDGEIEAIEIIDTISEESGYLPSRIDAVFWLFCSDNNGMICTEIPHCELCSLKGKYCNWN